MKRYPGLVLPVMVVFTTSGCNAGSDKKVLTGHDGATLVAARADVAVRTALP
jgi:hypothetical protein